MESHSSRCTICPTSHLANYSLSRPVGLALIPLKVNTPGHQSTMIGIAVLDRYQYQWDIMPPCC